MLRESLEEFSWQRHRTKSQAHKTDKLTEFNPRKAFSLETTAREREGDGEIMILYSEKIQLE